MSCTDQCNALRKLREGEREKKREIDSERESERDRERRKNGQNGFRSSEFGSLDIQLQFNYKQTTISEAQKKAKTLFFVYRP
jgi:hypothetical protein